ncbi:MAG: phospholipid carrier-dependent glycosyltransferase [Lachnospiraceae bacterium]|jgi:dolichyl-phosphate-mannose--protein O-mannosyl transferase|nr:phospholipid carrier-dependent glycosyltransferase [Lachnospiraceae bacterium]
MNKRDCLAIAILTLVFAGLAFYRLGGTTVPASSYTVTRENPTVVLDFGAPLTIDYFVVYFGPQSFLCDLYAREEEGGEWELIGSDVFSDEVYKWKGFFHAPKRLRYLRLELKNAGATFHEMLFVDEAGRLTVPVNAAAYPALFDEQGLFDPSYSKTYYNETIFDETFYARTAYEYIHGLPAYETSHPPLGKSLMSLGIRAFGMVPFGWRFMSALLGVMMVPLMYAFAKALTGSSFAATAATVLLAFDCMHFTLARIATIDIYAGFWILLMYYLFYLYLKSRSYLPLALCGAAFGLAAATKWTGIFAGAGLGLMFLYHMVKHRPPQRRRLLAFCTVFFVALPLCIYVLSYLPVVADPPAGLLQQAFGGGASMLAYHSAEIIETHSALSPFYEWPFDWRPLLYLSTPLEPPYYSSLSLLGNPAVWWAGLPCLAYCFYLALRKKDEKAGFLAVAYLAQYLPWAFVTEWTFIYHYYPATFFMFLAMGYTLEALVRAREWGRTAALGYLAVAVLVFVILYPVISGSPAPREYQEGLEWLPAWVLVQ